MDHGKYTKGFTAKGKRLKKWGMQSNGPLVSIIILNYNGTSITCDLLQSIEENNGYSNFEVIVVDNASRINPTSEILSKFPKTKLILNPENSGFAAGNNLGIKFASGDFLFIVNNDTEVTPGLLEKLVQVFIRFPDAGMVCPKFQFFYNKGIIEYAGYEEINVWTGKNSMIGHGERDHGQFSETMKTNFAHGGAMMISREVLEKVGPMAEEYFLYYEELDWSERIKAAGYSIYVEPSALIFHKESLSTGKNSTLKTYYLTRNRILFMRRNYPGWPFWVFSSYLILVTIPYNSLKFIFLGKIKHFQSFWRGILWHFNKNINFVN